MDYVSISLIGYLIAIIVGRFYNDRAIKTLKDKQKVRFVDAMSTYKVWFYAPYIVITVAYFLGLELKSNLVGEFTISYAVIFLFTSFLLQFRILEKLKHESFPSEFFANYILGQIIKYTGVAAFVIAVAIDIIAHV